MLVGTMFAVVIIGTSLYLTRSDEPGRAHTAVRTDPDTLPPGNQIPADPIEESIAVPERLPAPEGVDASGLYKNAFVLWDQLTEEERQRILSKPHDGVYDEAAEGLFQKIQPIMALLHEAARADYCDWALGDATHETRLLHLPRAQALAKLALWNAAHRMPTDPDGAVEDLYARAQLGRDVADTLIGFLVETSFEQGAVNLLQRHGASLSTSARDRAQELFSSADFEPEVRRAMQAETALVNHLAKLPQETLLELMRKSTNPPPAGDVAAVAQQREFESFLLDSERVQAEAKYLTQLYASLPDAMLWPRPQFDSWWKGIQAELPGHPLAQTFLPSVTAMRNAAERSRVQRSMVAAGLAILQQGPAELGKYPDPYTSGAFVYSANATGFELRSALQHKGAPLRMEFAVPPQ